VIINDLHFVELPILPDEADAVLIVNPNTVLTFSVAAQRLKAVSRKDPQVI
jgi:hypothetical protein